MARYVKLSSAVCAKKMFESPTGSQTHRAKVVLMCFAFYLIYIYIMDLFAHQQIRNRRARAATVAFCIFSMQFNFLHSIFLGAKLYYPFARSHRVCVSKCLFVVNNLPNVYFISFIFTTSQFTVCENRIPLRVNILSVNLCIEMIVSFPFVCLCSLILFLFRTQVGNYELKFEHRNI